MTQKQKIASLKNVIKRVGKKTALWEKTRRELKREFEAQGIVRCEVCGIDSGLSFAHSRKRRFISTTAELKEVALLCLVHHAQIERLSHEEMFEKVNEIIANRGEQVWA